MRFKNSTLRAKPEYWPRASLLGLGRFKPASTPPANRGECYHVSGTNRAEM